MLDDLEYVDNILTDSVLYNILSALNQRAVVLIPILIIFIYEIYAFIMEVKKPLEDE